MDLINYPTLFPIQEQEANYGSAGQDLGWVALLCGRRWAYKASCSQLSNVKEFIVNVCPDPEVSLVLLT